MKILEFAIVFSLATLASCSSPPNAAPPTPPTQERVAIGEARQITETVAAFGQIVRHDYAAGVRPAPRDAHPKGQGCVKARVAIADGLPVELRHGVFASSKTYVAWIRFSNGSAIKQADNVGDGRGMAIKLVGVSGKKLIPDEKYTQDFVMINHPVFFSKDVADYLVLAKGILAGRIVQALTQLPTTAKIISQMQAHVVRDMFEERYFSMSPYALGDRYAKFSAVPVRCGGNASEPNWPTRLPADPNFLRERMTQRLSRSDVCFDLAIQLQTDASTQPVENAAALWSEVRAPFATVAHVMISKQHFTSPAQQSFCENLSFTPWHGLMDFRPAGGINRLRLTAYRAGSQLRHELDHAPMIEPNGTEQFSN